MTPHHQAIRDALARRKEPPTPEQIDQAAQRVQAGWTAKQRRTRGYVPRWRPPVLPEWIPLDEAEDD